MNLVMLVIWCVEPRTCSINCLWHHQSCAPIVVYLVSVRMWFLFVVHSDLQVQDSQAGVVSEQGEPAVRTTPTDEVAG